MAIDIEGYGFEAGERTVRRLVEDIRILSPSGIERLAVGWEKHVGRSDQERFAEAERRAREAVEAADRGPGLRELQERVFGMTESSTALVSWQVEHGAVGHRAEAACQAALVGLLASDLTDEETVSLLVRPAAEALPWLLPPGEEPE